MRETHAFKFGCTAVYSAVESAEIKCGAGRRAPLSRAGGRFPRLGAPAAFAAAPQPPRAPRAASGVCFTSAQSEKHCRKDLASCVCDRGAPSTRPCLRRI